ncbi:MAG: Maf family protein [Leptospirales bacterium]|nr:Maf family protein [Leptospirales bacterium]
MLKNQAPPHLALASASPRRRQLLEQLGLRFSVIATEVAEDHLGATPAETVQELARCKARAAAASERNSIIVGCDTLVFLGDEPFGKPLDRAQARQFLHRLSANLHSVWTGLCVCSVDRDGVVLDERVAARQSLVRFRQLSADEIEDYLDSGEAMDKAGAYGIQGKGALLVDSIEGDYFNVVGLPLTLLRDLLLHFGLDILKTGTVLNA